MSQPSQQISIAQVLGLARDCLLSVQGLASRVALSDGQPHLPTSLAELLDVSLASQWRNESMAGHGLATTHGDLVQAGMLKAVFDQQTMLRVLEFLRALRVAASLGYDSATAFPR